jgi:hypothetical protein
MCGAWEGTTRLPPLARVECFDISQSVVAYTSLNFPLALCSNSSRSLTPVYLFTKENMSFFLRGHTRQGQPIGQPWPDAWVSNARGSYAPLQFIPGTWRFPIPISAGIIAPPWQWWTRSGTSPWGNNWAQRLGDGRIMNSMNERMIQKYVEK